jgi:hypothetical protein
MNKVAFFAFIAFFGLTVAASNGHADCWRFTDKGISGVTVDYTHAADRICALPMPGSASDRMLLKLYFQDETLANLIVMKPIGSRNWVVTEERTLQGSYQITGDELVLEFPFFKEGDFQLNYRGQTLSFPARLED